MNAEIITAGTELLLGHILDTNSLYLSRKLAEIGVNVHFKTSVGDNVLRLKEAVSVAASRADIILITGGLGPTVDDVTREAVSFFTGRKLVADKNAMAKIEEFFRGRGIKMPENNRIQAHIPEGSVIIENERGTAPGFIVEHNSKMIAAMPGVPSEMRPMMENAVMPYITRKYGIGGVIIKTRTIKVADMGESVLDEKIRDLFETSKNPSIGVYAHQTEIEVKITAKADSAAEADGMTARLAAMIKERLGLNAYGEDADTLESLAASELVKRKWTISTAESCTAGLLSYKLTNVAGSSAYFMGGISSYSNDVKKGLLGVPDEILSKHGAVSPECAEVMAIACRGKFDTDCSVSITGIAGPGGGTAEKPVGLVYIGVNVRGDVKVYRKNFGGTRDNIRARAAHTALYHLLMALK